MILIHRPVDLSCSFRECRGPPYPLRTPPPCVTPRHGSGSRRRRPVASAQRRARAWRAVRVRVRRHARAVRALFDKAGNQLPVRAELDHARRIHARHALPRRQRRRLLARADRGAQRHGQRGHAVGPTLFDPSDDDAATLYGDEPILEADEAKPRRAPHQIAAEKALKDQEQVEKAEQRAAAASQATNYQLTSNAGKSKATDQAQVARAYSAAAKKEGAAAAVRQPLPLTCCRRASRGLSTSCAEAEDGARHRGG